MDSYRYLRFQLRVSDRFRLGDICEGEKKLELRLIRRWEYSPVRGALVRLPLQRLHFMDTSHSLHFRSRSRPVGPKLTLLPEILLQIS